MTARAGRAVACRRLACAVPFAEGVSPFASCSARIAWWMTRPGRAVCDVDDAVRRTSRASSPTAVGASSLETTPPARSFVIASADVGSPAWNDTTFGSRPITPSEIVPWSLTPQSWYVRSDAELGQPRRRDVAGAVGQHDGTREGRTGVVLQQRATGARCVVRAASERSRAHVGRARTAVEEPERAEDHREDRGRRCQPPGGPLRATTALRRRHRDEARRRRGRRRRGAVSWMVASRRSHTPGGGGPPVCARNDAARWREITSARASASPRDQLVDRGALVIVDRVDRVRREQLPDLVGSQFTIHDSSIPRSSSCVRSRISPVRILLFTVPSGWPRIRATSRYVCPPKYRELDRFPLALGQGGHGRAHLLGDGEVVRLEIDVVVGDHVGTRRALLPLPATRVGAHPIDAARVRVHEQEGAERAATTVVALGVLPEAQEDLLHHLLGRHPLPEHPRRQREHGPGVAPVRLRERVLVVAADRDDQADVVGRGVAAGRSGSHGEGFEADPASG